ncbi:hypothetical protein [Dactylosporangium sp. NPDC048998]|uniref:hypothetical protein n=1 Tax=Dactylosporangium sp. NPDC048998 TaxID=3363976 RepID=UPI00371DE792
MRTDITSIEAAAKAGKPPKDVRGFWRILLAIVAPLPMLAQGLYYVLSPWDSSAAFQQTVHDTADHLSLIGALQWIETPFLVGLIPATFAVAWVARRRAPRLATAGAVLALLGDLAGFPLIPNGDRLTYLTASNNFDVTAMAALSDAEDNYLLGQLGGLLFIIGITIGLLLLGLALWRSHAAPAWMGWALAVGGFTHPFVSGIVPGYIAQGLGLWVAAVGFAGASYALLRMRNDEFDLPPGPTA